MAECHDQQVVAASSSHEPEGEREEIDEPAAGPAEQTNKKRERQSEVQGVSLCTWWQRKQKEKGCPKRQALKAWQQMSPTKRQRFREELLQGLGCPLPADNATPKKEPVHAEVSEPELETPVKEPKVDSDWVAERVDSVAAFKPLGICIFPQTVWPH